tara:strand:- start:5359 stop:5808 length:450 start_codon:yes stop_codon:yes gene_type:complete
MNRICLSFRIALCGLAVLLSGPSLAQAARDGLPPQPLNAGDCAAYFWERSEPHALIAVVTLTRGDGLLWQDGGAIAFTLPVFGDDSIRVGDMLAWDIVPAGARLEGEITEQRGEDYVLSRAFVRRTLADGALEVTPLVGLAGCNDRAEP